MKFLKPFLILIVLFGCKEPYGKRILEKSIIPSQAQPKSISELVQGIPSNLREGETLVLDFNLTMEDYVRNDMFHFTKSGQNVSVKAVITYGVEEIEDGIQRLNIPSLTYSLDPGNELSIETLIKKNLFRKDKKPRSIYVLKAYSTRDTLLLYSYNLADKGAFLKDYFDTASQIFPNKNAFVPGELGFPDIP